VRGGGEYRAKAGDCGGWRWINEGVEGRAREKGMRVVVGV
jgi:hypothetical protein